MLRLIFSIALPLTFFSWGSGTAQEKKLEPLVVSYSSFTGNRAPFWIAKELGLYEKYGLNVNLVSIAAGSVSLTALLAEKDDPEARWDEGFRFHGRIAYQGHRR